jgi:hypothetical protein
MEDYDLPDLIPMEDYSDMPPLIPAPLLTLYSILQRNTPFRVIEVEMDRLLANYETPVLEDLVALMFKTRDVRGGRGERRLFHYMFKVLNKYHPLLCKSLLLFIPNYGYWKDLFQIAMDNYNLFSPTLEICKAQLLTDEAALEAGRPISLMAKWIPKEGKSMSRFTKYFAQHLYGDIMPIHSSRMHHLRLRISRLNRALNTLETLQCANRWDEIDPAKVPTVARFKQQAAFLNEHPRHLGIRDPNNVKRMICRTKFQSYQPHPLKAKNDPSRSAPIHELFSILSA